MIVFVVSDLILNDYWGDDFASDEQVEEDVVVDEETNLDSEVVVVDDELKGDEEVEEVSVVLDLPKGNITAEFAQQLNLIEPVLTTNEYDGLVYGFWDVSEDFSDYTVLHHNLFDGPDFVGSIYETTLTSEIQTFHVYSTLRGLASTSGEGAINENDAYGDASFYFNHSTKTNTSFLTMQKGDSVYAFEYSHDYHENIRSLIELL